MMDTRLIKEALVGALSLSSMAAETGELLDKLISKCLANYDLLEEIRPLELQDLQKRMPEDHDVFTILKGSRIVYVGLLSLGPSSQAILEDAKDKDAFEYYLISEIYDLILNDCFHRMYSRLKEQSRENMHLTEVISPGEDGISLKWQKVIVDIINEPKVMLDEQTLFMIPVKSMTFLIGEGSTILPQNRGTGGDHVGHHKGMIDIIINGQSYQVPEHKRLYDVLVEKRIFFDSFCGGNHRCGRCQVTITHHSEVQTRLACDTYCTDGMEVVTHCGIRGIKIEEGYQGIRYHSDKAPGEDGYGIVFDVGTTTIVGAVYDLGSRKKLKVLAEHNEQYLYGLDVISRISYSLTHDDGLERLHQTIISQLNAMIKKLVMNSEDGFIGMVVVGNPTMISIINNINLSSLAFYPFESQVSRFITKKADELGLEGVSDVRFISGISGFIGSDILAGLVATRFCEIKGHQLLIDLGTNGELALGNQLGILACSTAAGPAFEGARISCGVPSIPGAICRLTMNNGNYEYATIDDKPPIGFCGSGIIDLVAGLLSSGLIDENGTFTSGDDFHITLGGTEFIIRQPDIRELQLAKGAIMTGLEILLQKAGIGLDQLDDVYISGGLGSSINVAGAIRIGLLPSGIEQKVHLIGNSAFYGASLYLLFDEYRDLFQKTGSIVHPFDLDTDRAFAEAFIRNIGFGKKRGTDL